jgi:hypothetical protein
VTAILQATSQSPKKVFFGYEPSNFPIFYLNRCQEKKSGGHCPKIVIPKIGVHMEAEK